MFIRRHINDSVQYFLVAEQWAKLNKNPTLSKFKKRGDGLFAKDEILYLEKQFDAAYPTLPANFRDRFTQYIEKGEGVAGNN